LPTGYTFTSIVVGNPSTAPLSVGSNAPFAFVGINSAGTVAFEAEPQPYTTVGFYTGSGSGTPTPIITSSSVINLTNDFLSINDFGFIGFIGCSGCAPSASFANTVYTSNGTVINSLVTGLQWSFGQLLAAPGVGINNAGGVTFQDPTTGNIVKADASGTQTVMASTASGFQSLSQGSINNLGAVAFTGMDANGSTGIFIGNGTTVTAVARNGGAFGQVVTNFPPAVNDSGTVAFAASSVPPNNVNGVFTSDGTTSSTITTSTALGFEHTAINNSGIVAFDAGNGSSLSLLVGAAGVAPETVIQTGGALAGSTVTSFVIGPNAINGVGQIAFWASLADGRTGIFRADPAPAYSGGQLVFAPKSWDFGAVKLGTSVTRKFNIANGSQTQALQVNVLPATPNPPYSLLSGGGMATIGAGQSEQIVVQFKPTVVTATSVVGSVPITSSDPNNPSASIPLSGRGK
jgi:hypothetical protein